MSMDRSVCFLPLLSFRASLQEKLTFSYNDAKFDPDKKYIQEKTKSESVLKIGFGFFSPIF